MALKKNDGEINANKRLDEILDVAKKHKVISVLTSSSKRKKSQDGEDEEIDLSGLREAMEELGPAFIKLGQLLASRPDMIGPEIAEDLKKLRDNTPVTPFDQMREVVETELGKPLEDIYSEFDETPLGSASIGQVYKATLKETGQEVAVKIQKPGIYDIIVADVKILVNLAGKADKYITKTRTYNLPAIMKEFERSIFKELNYMEEVMNIQKVTNNFKEDENIYIPQAFRDYSTSKVITMELVDGYEIADLFDNQIEGIDNKEIAKIGVQSFLKQILLDGFFHADPHPGNMFVTKDGKVAYIDWGMVGVITEEFRGNLAQMILILLSGDSKKLINQLIYMKLITPEQNTEEFQEDVEDLLNKYLGVDLDQMDGIFESLMNVMIKHNIILPREFVMIGRGFILLEDTGSRLDPQFNLTTELEKFAKKMISQKFSVGNIASGGLNYIVEIEHLLKDLPDKLNSTLNKLEDGNLEVKLKHGGLDDLKNMISLSLILAALIVGTALVLAATIVAQAFYKTTAGIPLDYVYIIALLGFIISLIIGIYIVFKYLRN
ncbi:MAG: AarF/ABC1/UbiB kinase family protein [Methanosphaera sp.]|uniref:ABC1 kinase family protein n=1 Tax=Methanosphaera sp. TaxID=2666342 RepID=UPI002E75C328|nr:AarF/ABC1/UbiB kinase family protein [Methanosphaera sp.]MEE1117094.1 AarF/ABC1/UbiB kinase family protein [Methanosphaera sp.]MEE3325141.1 AarF/ABC1/UbiB kinase family protein [Methanosphaera sp.]